MKHMDLLKKSTKVQTEFSKLYEQGVLGIRDNSIQLKADLFNEIFTDASRVEEESFVIDGHKVTRLSTEFGGKTFICVIR